MMKKVTFQNLDHKAMKVVADTMNSLEVEVTETLRNLM